MLSIFSDPDSFLLIFLLAMILIIVLFVMSVLLKNSTKTTIDEKSIDKLIDVTKWFVGSVALIIITQIIDRGIKDRQQGIAELAAYDKYITTITNNQKTKVIERKLLADFFASVTASSQLKRGWQEYRDSVKVEYDAFQNTLKEKEKKREEFLLRQERGDSLSKSERREFAMLGGEILKSYQQLEISSMTTAEVLIKLDGILRKFIFNLNGKKSLEISIAKEFFWEFDQLYWKDLAMVGDSKVLSSMEKVYNGLNEIRELYQKALLDKNKKDDYFELPPSQNYQNGLREQYQIAFQAMQEQIQREKNLRKLE